MAFVHYKILHVPTGYYIYDQYTIIYSRRAIELLAEWLNLFYDTYDTRREQGENNYGISIGSPEIYEEYHLKHKIPLRKEFEIIAVQV